jgi:glycosyltransferase involved in cell wall biosynthesis
MTPRVAYWNNIPSPYMVDRFNVVADRGNLDFEAWFSARTMPDRTWRVDEKTWGFAHRYLPRVALGGFHCSFPAPLLRGKAPDVLVTLHSRPEFIAASMIGRSKGARTAFWVLPTYDAWVKRREWKEQVKRYVFPRVDAILTSGQDGRRFAKRYGTHDDRILHVPQVVDVAHFATARTVPPDDRQRLREQLNVRGVTFTFVGRLWLGKGLQFLIDAFAQVQRDLGPGAATLLLVGDGVDEQRLRARAAEVTAGHVVFTGFKHSESLPEIYAASDVFVFPTLGDPYGLVVLEAMAAALPIISTTAAGEIRDRVQDDVNGFLVQPGNPDQLAARMLVLARDASLRTRMGAASASAAAGLTPETWARSFEQAVTTILSMPPLRSIPR